MKLWQNVFNRITTSSAPVRQPKAARKKSLKNGSVWAGPAEGKELVPNCAVVHSHSLLLWAVVHSHSLLLFTLLLLCKSLRNECCPRLLLHSFQEAPSD